VHDPVEDRVAHVDVRARHVDASAEDTGAVRELAGTHPGKEVEALLHLAVAPRALATGLRQRAAVLADLVGREVVHVGGPGADEVERPLVELLEVVGRVVEVLAPVEPEPANVRLDGVDVLLLLLDRVRVVEPQVAAAARLGRDPEVQADRLRMADVQVAVGLGREARHRHRVPPGRQVVADGVADEVGTLRRGRRGHG
jgi:hypothetical protein